MERLPCLTVCDLSFFCTFKISVCISLQFSQASRELFRPKRTHQLQLLDSGPEQRIQHLSHAIHRADPFLVTSSDHGLVTLLLECLIFTVCAPLQIVGGID